jgi:hypothetical protein
VDFVYVVDADGRDVTDPAILKPAGVWPYYALVKTGPDFLWGLAGVAILSAFGFFAATRPPGMRTPPDAKWFQRGPVLGILASVIVVGWVIIAALPGVPKAAKGAS